MHEKGSGFVGQRCEGGCDAAHFCPIPDPAWPLAASDRSFELTCSRDRRARSRLSSKRILPFSTNTCAMPPRRAKSSLSLIVSTAAPFTPVITVLTCASLKPEMNSRWQPRSALPRRTRLAATSPPPPRAAPARALQGIADRAFVKHAGVERSSCRQHVVGPLGELREVVDEGRLQRRLGHVLCVRRRGADQDERRGGGEPPGARDRARPGK